jgi:cobalamin synthase
VASRDDWQRRLGPLYGGAVALVHSTPWRWPTEVGDSPRTAGWMVALGAPIGAAAWCVAALARGAGLPPGVAALLGLAALSLASAVLVERGLADRIDHWDAQWTARGDAARDARRGPGIAALLAVVFATLVRAAAISAMPPSRWLGALIATAIVGRWAAMFLQAIGEPIEPGDARRSLVAAPAPPWLVAAISLAVAAVTLIAIGKVGIVALAIAAIAAFGLGIEAQRRDGGLSSPVVATVAGIGELVVLLVAAI